MPRSRLFSRVTTTSPTPATWPPASATPSARTSPASTRSCRARRFSSATVAVSGAIMRLDLPSATSAFHDWYSRSSISGRPPPETRPWASYVATASVSPQAQSGAGHLLPLVVEPPHLGELRGELGPVAHQEPERPAGVDGGQLRPVPGQQHLGPRPFGRAHQLVQAERPGQAGLVDDHQLARPQLPGGDVVVEGGHRRPELLRTGRRRVGGDVGGARPAHPGGPPVRVYGAIR